MNIISSKVDINRMADGINTILSLPEEQFDTIIQLLTPSNGHMESIRFFYTTDECEMPQNPIQIGLEQEFDEGKKYISRSYFGVPVFSMHEIYRECQRMLEKYPSDSLEYSRLNKFMHTRDWDNFKDFYLSTNTANPMLLDKIYEILSDDDMLSKFIDYNNNTESFAINGQDVPMAEYLECLGRIFGNRNSRGELSFSKNISRDFFIPNWEEIKERYFQILDNINMDKYVNPYYTFSRSRSLTDKIVRDGDEPDWEIAPGIREAIFTDMPQDLSLEEQAMYIYCKMCSIFSYDEGYLYRFDLNRVNYSSIFSKEYLESILPGDKITCYDFCRMYSELVKELGGDITAVMVLEGINQGHASTGFYTDNVSVALEAVNVASDQDYTNDLTKARNGILLDGIKPISDRNGILEQALDKVYPLALGQKPKTIPEFIQSLKATPKDSDIPNDTTLKLQSLLETMKSNHVFGNEFTQTLWGVTKSKYFGDTTFEKAYMGELTDEHTSNERFVRHILLREQTQDSNSPRQIYLINTDTLDLTICSKEDIISRLNSGEWIYEDPNHKLPGIDKEV